MISSWQSQKGDTHILALSEMVFPQESISTLTSDMKLAPFFSFYIP